MRGLRAVGCVTTAVAMAVVVVGAEGLADPGSASHVDVVSAVVDANGIAVTGKATFVDVPVMVGDDDEGDAVGAAAPLGHDLTTATISRPDPSADTMRFAVTVKNQPPETDGVPELVRYEWSFGVSMGGVVQHDIALWAWRSSQRYSQGTVEPTFIVRAFPPDGGSTEQKVTGVLDDSTVAWDVPVGLIGQAGSTLEDGVLFTPVVKVTVSAEGTTNDTSASHRVVVDDMTIDPGYVVPGPGVRIGIAPFGTAPGEVPLTAVGAVSSQGAFTGRLPAPATPGEYTVVAQACYGPRSCGIATTTVTVQ